MHTPPRREHTEPVHEFAGDIAVGRAQDGCRGRQKDAVLKSTPRMRIGVKYMCVSGTHSKLPSNSKLHYLYIKKYVQVAQAHIIIVIVFHNLVIYKY